LGGWGRRPVFGITYELFCFPAFDLSALTFELFDFLGFQASKPFVLAEVHPHQAGSDL